MALDVAFKLKSTCWNTLILHRWGGLRCVMSAKEKHQQSCSYRL